MIIYDIQQCIIFVMYEDAFIYIGYGIVLWCLFMGAVFLHCTFKNMTPHGKNKFIEEQSSVYFIFLTGAFYGLLWLVKIPLNVISSLLKMMFRCVCTCFLSF
jgi:hypothetical protein